MCDGEVAHRQLHTQTSYSKICFFLSKKYIFKCSVCMFYLFFYYYLLFLFCSWFLVLRRLIHFFCSYSNAMVVSVHEEKVYWHAVPIEWKIRWFERKLKNHTGWEILPTNDRSWWTLSQYFVALSCLQFNLKTIRLVLKRFFFCKTENSLEKSVFSMHNKSSNSF